MLRAGPVSRRYMTISAEALTALGVSSTKLHRILCLLQRPACLTA